MITLNRRIGTNLALLVVLLSTMSGVGLAQKKNQVRWWRGTFSAAEKEATERNVPILIALIQDGEEANERLIDDVFTNAAFVKMSQETIPIIATQKRHGSKGAVIDGIEKEVCKRLGGCTCDHHIDAEVHVFRKYFTGTQAKTPQVMICKPNLELVERIVDIAGPKAYETAVRKVKKSIGPGLDGPMFRTARSNLTKGRNLIKMGRYSEAWAEVAPLAKVGGSSPFVKKAKDLHDQIEAKVNEVLEKAYRLADQKDYWQAMTMLDSVVTDFKGTPPAVKAEAALKSLGKTKDGRSVAKQLKKQKRFLPWMEKARSHENRGEYEKARKLYRRVRDKGKKLPIARKAEEKLAAFRNDVAISAVLKALDRVSESKKLLKEATKMERAGDTKGAKALYERLVKDYAGTKASKTAKSKL
ncbi:MAG: hypothetical protein ACI97A_002501 [Planctomycetota bacterium]|jgi:hypothetical protein